MDTLFHFVFAILAGLAFGLHRKHRLSLIIFTGFCSILIDLDHFLVPLGYATQYRSFHNIFIIFVIPCILFLIFHYLERNRASDKFQIFFLLLMVMLIGHVIADMFYSSVQILYPLSDRAFSLPDVTIQATDKFSSPVVAPQGIGIAIYGITIFIGTFIHDILYHQKHNHVNLETALRSAIKDWF